MVRIIRLRGHTVAGASVNRRSSNDNYIQFVDNRSTSIRLNEIIQVISRRDVDPNITLEQLDTLVRILRNTGDVAGHVSKNAIINS